MAETRYLDAIRAALDDELAAFERERARDRKADDACPDDDCVESFHARPGALAALPPGARDTVPLSHRRAPVPYAKDGSVFYSREALLHGRPSGYYREYTVSTPGARDRGARRIVRGRAGELYYSGDHYRSFKRIRK